MTLYELLGTLPQGDLPVDLTLFSEGVSATRTQALRS